jgi:two-component system chemotaxis response regulator CheB
MPAGFTRGFAERIDRLTRLRAIEAEGGEVLSPGTVLIAPGGKHLELENIRGRVVTRLIASNARDKYTPSVDRLFESAAKHIGADLLAVVLTGMGDDGRSGVRSVNLAGGRIIAESESTAVIFGMPQQAIRTGLVDQVLPLGEIAAAIQVGYRDPSRRAKGDEGTS